MMIPASFPRAALLPPRWSACLLAASFLFVAGCGEKANVVFDIKLDRFLPDGRPVIHITPNGQPRPAGTGPFGDYFLVLRSSSDQPYTRQFDKDQAARGVKLDFMVTKANFKPSERITVAVENPEGRSLENSTRLSNTLELKFP